MPEPIGPEPQNLNSDKWYASGRENQLKQWVRQGYLEPGYPKNINTVVDWKDPSQDIDLRARSYLDINCAHCHDEGRSCSYRAIRLGFRRLHRPGRGAGRQGAGLGGRNLGLRIAEPHLGPRQYE